MFQPLTEIDLGVLSDLHKDAYGFRPTTDWLEGVAKASAAEQEEVWNDLRDYLVTQQEERTRLHKLAAEKWEEHITRLTKDFGISRADAIRWDMQSIGGCETELEVAEYAWNWGLDSDLETQIYATLME